MRQTVFALTLTSEKWLIATNEWKKTFVISSERNVQQSILTRNRIWFAEGFRLFSCVRTVEDFDLISFFQKSGHIRWMQPVKRNRLHICREDGQKVKQEIWIIRILNDLWTRLVLCDDDDDDWWQNKRINNEMRQKPNQTEPKQNGWENHKTHGLFYLRMRKTSVL